MCQSRKQQQSHVQRLVSGTLDSSGLSCVRLNSARVLQAVWVQFSPDTHVTDISTWQMYKLGHPISPLEVVANGSHSQHAVSDEGIAVLGAGPHASERLSIR